MQGMNVYAGSGLGQGSGQVQTEMQKPVDGDDVDRANFI